MNYINLNKVILSSIIVISILCAFISGIILLEKKGFEQNQAGICLAITGSDGCETVQTSKFAETFGIDNPLLGIIGFLALGMLAATLMKYDGKHRKFIRLLTIFGAFAAGMVAIYFLILQAFVLHKYCFFCVIVDILSIILACIAVYVWRKKLI